MCTVVAQYDSFLFWPVQWRRSQTAVSAAEALGSDVGKVWEGAHDDFGKEPRWPPERYDHEKIIAKKLRNIHFQCQRSPKFGILPHFYYYVFVCVCQG